MRPVVRGDAPADETGLPITFTDYKQARDALIARMGDYCSYCEIALPSEVDVEHMLPKSLHEKLELEWSNFLLACSNCNSIKGNQPATLDDYYWPDQDNTLRAFLYELDEPPQVSTTGTCDPTIALRTLELTGLDRVPGHPRYSDRDRRWKKRMEAWNIALFSQKNLTANDCTEMREQIIVAARATGFWSIWYHVFYLDQDMQDRLIDAFPGTDRHCFDPKTRAVVERPGGKI